jgi:N-acetylneuraminate lyase
VHRLCGADASTAHSLNLTAQEEDLLKLTGIMPALFTSYDRHGEVTTKGLDKYLSFLIERGCTGFFVGGSTGEGLLQTVEERCRFLEGVVKTVAGQVPVIAHVGSLSTRDACELARFASKVGADAVGSVMPVYYSIGIKGGVEYYRAIGKASRLPLLIYYLAANVGPLDPVVFAEHFAPLPRVFAMKYTSPDMELFRRIIENTEGKLNMIMGCDQCLLPALTMGADGGIGTTYCFMPELFVGVYESHRSGEIKVAEELMARAFKVIYLILGKYPSMEACREIMRLRGINTGHSRGPLPTLSPEQAKQLKKDLEALNFFSDPIR